MISSGMKPDGRSDHHIELLECARAPVFPQEDTGPDDLAAEGVLTVF